MVSTDEEDFFDEEIDDHHYGYSALHKTILQLDHRKAMRIIQKLLEQGADVNMVHPDHLSCLHTLARRGYEVSKVGNCELLQLLLNAGAQLNVSKRGVTPLGLAAFYGDYKLVQAMIHAGADVNLYDCASASPLYGAVTRAHQDIVELLVERGARVNIRDEDGKNMLWAAAQKHHDKSKANAYINILNLIIEYSVDKNCKDFEYYVPFKAVLRSGTTEAMHIFFRNGIDLQNCGVRFPLHEAAGNGNIEILDFLLKTCFYNVNQTDNLGWTPVFDAINSSRPKNLTLLIEWGADVNISRACSIKVPLEAGGKSPLFHAVFNRKQQSVEVLLAAGAKVNRNEDDQDEFSILNMIRHSKDSMITNRLVAQLALLRVQENRRGSSSEIQVLRKVRGIDKFYKECYLELGVLQKLIISSTSLFEFLTAKDVTSRINVNIAIEYVRSINLKFFPIYGTLLTYRLSMAQSKQEVMKRAAERLNELLGLRFTNIDHVLYTIMSDFRMQDLQNLCNA